MTNELFGENFSLLPPAVTKGKLLTFCIAPSSPSAPLTGSLTREARVLDITLLSSDQSMCCYALQVSHSAELALDFTNRM